MGGDAHARGMVGMAMDDLFTCECDAKHAPTRGRVPARTRHCAILLRALIRKMLVCCSVTSFLCFADVQQRSDSTRSFQLVATLLQVRNENIKDLLYYGMFALRIRSAPTRIHCAPSFAPAISQHRTHR